MLPEVLPEVILHRLPPLHSRCVRDVEVIVFLLEVDVDDALCGVQRQLWFDRYLDTPEGKTGLDAEDLGNVHELFSVIATIYDEL